jgi:hypothetical protein
VGAAITTVFRHLWIDRHYGLLQLENNMQLVQVTFMLHMAIHTRHFRINQHCGVAITSVFRHDGMIVITACCNSRAACSLYK